MKTTTILAWERRAYMQIVAANGKETEGQARQWHTLYRKLIARIESGDRAREALAEIAELNLVDDPYTDVIILTARRALGQEPQP